MRGKILLSAVALSLSAAAFASGAMPAPEPINYFDGFYVGVAAGIQTLQSNDVTADAFDRGSYVDTTSITEGGRTVTTTSLPFPLDPADHRMSGDMGKSSATGDLFIGYGQTFHPDNMGDGLYAGIEIYGSIGQASPSMQHETNWYEPTAFDVNGVPSAYNHIGAGSSFDQVELQNKYAFGALLKGGYLMTPKSMIYIALGTEYAKFDVSGRHAFVYSNTYPVSETNFSFGGDDVIFHGCYDFSEHKWAFVPGIGIETMVANNWSLRAQYTYAIYPSFSGCDVDAHLATVVARGSLSDESFVNTRVYTLGTATEASFKPRIGKFELGLTYHANGV